MRPKIRDNSICPLLGNVRDSCGVRQPTKTDCSVGGVAWSEVESVQSNIVICEIQNPFYKSRKPLIRESIHNVIDRCGQNLGTNFIYQMKMSILTCVPKHLIFYF
jgi:hypothetical protein